MLSVLRPRVLSGVGQIRWRRYRPFNVPSTTVRKAPVGNSVSTVSSETVTTVLDDSDLFRCGPLHGMKLLESFSPINSSFRSANDYLTLSLRLDIDTRRQSVRGVCHLPNGLKTNTKLLVFCSDFDAAEMIEAGADFAGMNDLLQRIGKGWSGFDRCIATPAVMPQVMKVAKVLGPRKLMPNPKSGTLVTDLKKAIVEAKSGTLLEYRTLETEPIVTVRIGSLSASTVANLDNVKFFIREILKQKTRQVASASSEESAAGGRLTTLGGISMIPNIEKLNRLMNLKRKEQESSGGKNVGKKFFIQSAFLQLGDDNGPRVDLDPELILPSSPAYYR